MVKHLLFLIFISSASIAQTKNPAFGEMLDSLYKKDIPYITVDDFLVLNKNEVFVLDARETEEFKVSHLKNARHVGYFWFDMRNIYDIPRTAPVVVYCSVGVRSAKIVSKLQKAGYAQVFNLYGGIFEWVNSGQPVYKLNGVQTSEVHTFNADWDKWLIKGTKVH